jgi:WD40 repeat protein
MRGENPGLLPAGGGQAWEYAGTAGERLSIRVAADSPANRIWGVERQIEAGLLDATLAVYAPDGSLLAEADDLENGVATDAYLESIELPQDGIYRIEVRSYRDQTGGGYRLILADPRPLAFKAGLPTTFGLAIHPDGRTAIVGVGEATIPGEIVVADGRIWVWDLETGEVIRQLEGHGNTPVAIAVSPDGKRALSADVDGGVILWDLSTWEEIDRFENSGSMIWGILFHPDGQTALTASADGFLARWDLATGERMLLGEKHGDWVMDLAVSPDGQTAYSLSWLNEIRVWDLAGGETIATHHPFFTDTTRCLALSPDGSQLLVGPGQLDLAGREIQKADIALLDARTGETLLNLEGHTAEALSLVFSPDGRYALSGSRDQTVRLWDVITGEQLAVLTGHTGIVWRVAFSPDGLTGYSTSDDGSFRVWDLSEFIGESASGGG